MGYVENILLLNLNKILDLDSYSKYAITIFFIYPQMIALCYNCIIMEGWWV